MNMNYARYGLQLHWFGFTGSIVMLTLTLTSAAATAATACENLSRLSLSNTTITLAQSIAAGAFHPAPPPPGSPPGPPGEQSGALYDELPAFCRVQATLRPTSDSDIKMELWLPVEQKWNHRFRGTGNGGLGGGAVVNSGPLAAGARLGYATAGNNTGHEGDSSYAIGHPEKIKDFGYRSAHEMTVASKALIKAYYDAPLELSLMAEGGGGTIAALSSAQRYPQDYDIIAVVGMSSNLSRHVFGQMWIWQATHQSEASFIPPEKYSVLHNAALAACDARDGLKDGIISDPENCKFDPSVAQCKATIDATCLSAAQVEAAGKIYAGPRNPRTHEQIYSPLYPGSELGWGLLAGSAEPFRIPLDFFKYYVFQDPDWDYRKRPLDWDQDVALAERPEIAPVNAVNPDLSKFFARGGKLLLVDGWSDTAVPPKVAIDYYKNVVATLGHQRVDQSMRFFMVPGMGHGPGTAGTENFNFDALSLIEQWQATGNAPEELIVTHYKDGAEAGNRVACRYPQTPRYRGTGETEVPTSFVCR